MTSPAGGPLPRPIAVAFAGAAFLALALCGLGLVTLLLDRDAVDIVGGGPVVPGLVGMLLALAIFALALAFGLRAQHPSFWTAPVAAIAVWLAWGAGLLAGAVVEGVGPAAAVAGAGDSLVSWFGVVVGVSALLSAWGGVALVRTRADRPRWRWERDDDDE